MKKFFTFLCLCLPVAWFNIHAQHKVSPQGVSIIEQYHKTVAEAKQANGLIPSVPVYKAIITLSGHNGANALTKAGIEVTSDLGDMVIAIVPINRVDEIAAMNEVKYISFGEKQQPMLDFARPSGKVDEVQNGFMIGNNQLSFDGTGIVCGMVDVGLEGNHENFLNADGTSRIKRLWWMKGTNGNAGATSYTDQTISTFTTDDSDATHATHVGGIIGGYTSKLGKSSVLAQPSGSFAPSIKEDAPIPFYGVATGCDFAFSVGELYDANVLDGLTNIVDYAAEVGKPCVINMSLGSTSGPHDGTDQYSSFISRIGQKAIVCMSAGNDGDKNISITKTFTSSDMEMKTFITDNKATGVTDVWAETAEPLTVKWVIYNIADRSSEVIASVSKSGESVSVSSSSNEVFAKGFSGSIQMVANVNPLNNRFNAWSNLSVTPLTGNKTMFLSLQIEGKSGQKVYVYGNSNTQFTSRSMTQWTEGSPMNSINNSACANNIISVGAYTTRITWGALNGATWSYTDKAFVVNKISPFSSYGTNFKGENLPLICAPGANIISSFSRFYVAKGNKNQGADDMSASVKSGRLLTDYWGAMQGTSMSCPFVTGVIGLWLEACPTLDYERVMDVINNTSAAQTTDPARWGAGKIDALAGVKYVLQKYAANGAVWEDDEQRLVVMPNGAGYDVTMAGEASFTVTVYDIQGRPVTTARGIDGQASVGTSELSAGIYVLAAQGASSRLTRKITVR